MPIAIQVNSYFRIRPPLVIAKEYDQRWKRWRTTVAIQVNMSAQRAVPFYLLDRHAPLAMTMGTNLTIAN